LPIVASLWVFFCACLRRCGSRNGCGFVRRSILFLFPGRLRPHAAEDI
jgi:hypothetical protein